MNWISILSGTDWVHCVGFCLAAIATISLIAVCVAGLLQSFAAVKDGLLLSALIACLVVPFVGLFTAIYQSSLITLPVAIHLKSATKAGPYIQRLDDNSSTRQRDSESIVDIGNHEDAVSKPRNTEPIEQQPAVVVTKSRLDGDWSLVKAVQYLAAAGWVLGTTILLASGWLSHRRGCAIRNRAVHIETDLLAQNARIALHQVGLNRIPSILGSNEVYAPVVQGVLSPAVIIPKGVIHQLSSDQMKDVLVHEFAHIRRHDTLVVMGETVARALYWPIFTVHLMIRALGRTREDVCDNFVLQHRNSVFYAETLLKLAELAQGRVLTIPSIGILNWRGAFENRIEGLLNERRSRSKYLSTKIFAPLLTVFVLIGITIAGSRLVAIEGPEKSVDAPKNTERKVLGSETSPPSNEGSSEKANAKIRVVDWQGSPVADAQVELWQLAYASAKGFGGGSQSPGAGDAFNGRTDEKGEIVVPYPTVVGPSEMPVTRLGLRIVTPDNPTWSDYRVITDDKPIVLSRPIIVSISASLGLDGSIVLSSLYAMTDKNSTTWKMDSARLVSGPMDASDGQLRVIYAPDDGPAWFSKIIQLEAYKVDENRIMIDTFLEPSAMLRGKLGDEIALPIQNGRILARASTSNSAEQDWKLAIGYVAPVSIDGEFVLTNLPAQSHVQLLAICDGGVSRSPRPSEVREYSKQHGYSALRYEGGNAGRSSPQLYFADATASRLLVPMDPTGDVEVTVEDWDAKPISGAKVSFNPNQTWLNGGSQMLGEGMDTLTYLRMGFSNEPFTTRRGFEVSTGFSAISNADGKAIVRNLPAGIGVYERGNQEQQNFPYLGFNVKHDHYTLVPKEPRRIISAGDARETVDMIPLGLAKIRARMDRLDNPGSVEVIPQASQTPVKPETESAKANENKDDGKTAKSEKKPLEFQTKPITVIGVARDLQGSPISGAKIYLISVNGIIKRISSTMTDGVGRYTFENAEMPFKGNGGTIQVYGIAEGYGLIWHGMRFVTFAPRPTDQPRSSEDHTFFDDEPIEMHLQFPPAAKLHGYVLDENQRPVANAKLGLGNLDFLDTNGRTMHHNFREFSGLRIALKEFRSATTNGDGYFEINNLPLHSVAWVGISHEDYAQQSFYVAITDRDIKEYTYIANTSHTIRNGKQVTNPIFETRAVAVSPLAIRVANRETIAIRLVNAGGLPLENLDVFASSVDDATGIFANGKSDSDGKLSLKIPPGEYRLSVNPRKSDYVPTEEVLVVKSGSSQNEERTVIVTLGCTLILRAVDAEKGTPLKDVSFWKEVEGKPGSRTGMTSSPEFVDHPLTNEEGELLAIVKPGKRVFGVGWSGMPEGYYRSSSGRTINCESGKTLRVTFELRKSK